MTDYSFKKSPPHTVNTVNKAGKCEIVLPIVKDTSDANTYVKVNHKDTKYIKTTNYFRFPKMSKGKKGGDHEHPAGPGQGQGSQPGGGQMGKGQGPTPAPPQAPPHATPPPKPLPGGQNLQVKQVTATGEPQVEGKSNPREDAIKKMAADSKKALASATKSKHDDLFKPDNPLKFPPPGGDGVEKNGV